jgi:two-component system, NtrC family, sensor kinase
MCNTADANPPSAPALRATDRARCRALLRAARARDAELRRLRNELDDGERRTRQIINTANDAFVSTDIAGRITEWNTTAEQLFGWSAEEAVGRRLDRYLRPPGTTGRHAAEDAGGVGLAEVLEACGDASRGEMLAVCRDGHVRPVEVSISMMVEDDRFLFNAFVHDISDRQAMQRQLVQAQKLESIGQLAAGIAHEINTPTQYVGDNLEFLDEAAGALRSVLGAYRKLAEALEGGHAEDAAALLANARAAERDADLSFLLEELTPALSQARDGVSRVAAIVRSMKAFSHPGGDGMQLVNLNEAIGHTVNVCRSEWKYVAELTLDLDPALPDVPCEPGEINQVVLNLVVNAAQALKAAGFAEGERGLGRITVRSRVEAGYAVVTVADNGPGVPAAHREKVFDPFFTTKPVGQGTGQGLAIAHDVVTRRHHGALTLDPPASEGGASFTLRLPLKAATRSAA